LEFRVGIAASLMFNSPENARPVPGPLLGPSGVANLIRATFSSSTKFGVPRPVTYATQSQPTTKISESKSDGRTNRIPSRDSRESIRAAAALARARCNVVEVRVMARVRRMSDFRTVQPRIEEAKRAPPLRNQEVIKQ
jgi:hypothetical protein